MEFSRLGFAVLLAESGLEAEEYATNSLASLVVLDVSTMKLSGYAACARIRRQNGYAKLPIVVTANTLSAQDYAAGEKAGATILLAKPYSITDLIQAVSPHLGANDPLLTHPAKRPGMAEAALEWKPKPNPVWRFGSESGLSRNGAILSVVRGKGVKIPLARIS